MNKRTIILVLFLGSLLGFSEVFLGNALYGNDFAHAGVILSIIALSILAISHTAINRRGIPTLIASIAVLFRMVNAGPFYCHLLAIFMLGAGFDLITSTLRKEKYAWLSGPLSAWLGYSLFAFSITYIFRYHYWTTGGITKVFRYIGISGSLVALGSLITVPLGYKLGNSTERFFELKTGFAYSGAIIMTVAIWIIGGIV